MLQAALEAEVNDFLAEHQDQRDAAGRRLVVRNGYLPPREIVTGAGPLEIQQPRARDKSSASEGRAEFVPKIIPAYLRRSKSIEEFIPWLYLKGISTGDFPEVMRSLLGKDVPGLSANVVVRLKEVWCSEYATWSRRDLSDRRYVYIWAVFGDNYFSALATITIPDSKF